MDQQHRTFHGIVLGEEYEDSITGFKGIAIAFCHYLTSCTQINLLTKVTDGNEVKNYWVDAPRLVGYDELSAKLEPGGPGDPPTNNGRMS